MLMQRASEKKMVLTSKEMKPKSPMADKAARAARLAQAAKAAKSAKRGGRAPDAVVQDLLERGRKTGILTLEDVNRSLPTDMVSPDQLDEVMDLFYKNDIEIVETENIPDLPANLGADSDDEKDSESSSRTENREDLDAA